MPFFIRTEPIPSTNLYKLIESVIIEGIKIPAGFTWNGASIPRALWPVIGSPFEPRLQAPAMVHDYCCHSGFNRKKADKVFRKLLIANGVSKVRANIMYAGVRAAAFWSCGG